MDIAQWLQGLGLPNYAALFREQAIDAEVLPSLTDADFEKLGLPLGHRKKLLKAIATLEASSSSTASIPRTSHAERRQLTLMLVDLVGSTALSARLDPEDMREIIGAYHRCCAEQITKAGGFVAKYMGDGVLAYFGYPQAHEDDAERAVRIGLSLTEAIPKLPTGHDARLQVRVGIATGLVVVGDLIGEGDAQERGVVGDTPNLAARLQSLAEPGQVVISKGTRRLTGGTFEYRDLGKVALKGLADPVQVWQVSGISAVRSRFEAQHESLTALVGREEELELLFRHWQRAKGGEGQVVLLSGEPGIGKSRLTVALEDRFQTEPHTRVRYFCSPHHSDSALYPTITQLERVARFERDDTPQTKLDKLTALVDPSARRENDVQLLSELLSIPTADRYAALNLSPQRKREMTFNALLRQLQTLTRQQPLFLIYEDAHWIDPSSRELLDMTVERVATLSVLLIITFRPEFQPPWSGQAHVSTLTLGRLGRREGAALIQRVAGSNAFPDEIMTEIVERADGIPLFVEELTKAVLEAGSHTEDGAGSVSTASLPALAVPATLHASLMARLDRLGPSAREIAQTGAAIGREFPYELLTAVLERSDADLEAPLRRLSDAGLILYRGLPPRATFLFKHALVRDAAYATLLRSDRKELHRRIAQVLEQRFPDVVELEPEILAQHYVAAGMIAEALRYWFKAGNRAAHRSANQEAIRHLRKGLEQLSSLRQSLERTRQELEFQTALGPALLATKGWGAPEALATYLRARDLAMKVGDTPQLFASLWGTWLIRWARGEIAVAKGLVGELLDLAHRDGSDALRLQAHHAGWTTFTYIGDLKTAIQHAEEGKAIYRPEAHGTLAMGYGGHDPGVCARAHASQPLWLIGYPDKALRSSQQSLSLAQELSHAPSMSHALFHAAWLDQFRRDEDAARDKSEALIRTASDQGQVMYVAIGTIFLGWALAVAATLERGIELLRQGLRDYRATGAESWVPYYGALLAERLWQAGSAEEAMAVLHEAQRAANRAADQFFWEPEMRRLEGELRLSSRSLDAGYAEEDFLRAIATAQERHARALELRASISLARLWRDQDKRIEARNALAPIYGWFTEGLDTQDLKEAKALLDMLE